MRGLAGGRMWCVCLVPMCVQTFKLVCGFVGSSARKQGGRVSGFEGSHSSGVRKFCFSLHQPICPHICSASQTPLCFLALLCQSVIQSFSLLLLKSWYLCGCVWLCAIKGVITLRAGAEKMRDSRVAFTIWILLQYSLERLASTAENSWEV